jgi:hypothetical protein
MANFVVDPRPHLPLVFALEDPPLRLFCATKSLSLAITP